MTDLFLSYLRLERNRSEETIRRYDTALREFEAFLLSKEEGLDWASVDADLIRDWLEAQLDKGKKATSVCANLSAVRSFYRFALSRGLVDHDPAHSVTGPKKHKPLPQFVKESEMDYLLDKTKWSDDDYKDVRARTIIILLYETGLRCSEVVGLNNGDIDLDGQQLKVTGKRNKQRVVPFGNEVEQALRQYIAIRDEQIEAGCDALFLNTKGNRINAKEVYLTVKDSLSLVTSMKKRSPHVLRHSYATAMLNHNAGIESVRRLLGHESLQTTQIYTHTTFEQLKRAYKEAHPRG